MKYLLTIIVSILLWNCAAADEELKFDIIKGKKTLGELQVAKFPNQNGFDIHIESQIKFWFFGTRRLIYSIYNNFKESYLLTAGSKSTLNDKTRHETSITKESNQYTFKDLHENETHFCDTSRIRYTIGYMYFKEPTHINKVYSERYLEYLPIEKVEEHRYKIILPNGTKNYFKYVNGIAVEVEVNHTLAKFYFKKKN
ncbi:MAG: hypothetical protein HKN92_07415 [Chitinophagales bacterium]|nr:hypothetical protein [Chitinophagales bacterium]